MTVKTVLLRRSVTAMAVATALATSGYAMAGGTTTSGATGMTDRLIVKYKSNGFSADAQQIRPAQAVAEGLGMSLQMVRTTAIGAKVVKLNRRVTVAEAAALAAQMRAADDSIEFAEPDRIMRAMFIPNDTNFNQQWDFTDPVGGMNLPAAWDISTGSGVKVAVLDTGYRPHIDLAGNIVGGYDFIGDTFVSNDGDGRDADASDPGDAIKAGECGDGYPEEDQTSSWHGTHVAGTIGAVSNNGRGVAGVAFNAKVVPVRVLGKCGGYTSDIADAIIWAAGGSVAGVPANANPARVINMSLGGGGACDTTTQNAINSARSRGAVVVVAAGNESQDASNSSPANCQGVVTVAATSRAGSRASYSNYGTIVDVAAPGGEMRNGQAEGILSTLNSGSTSPGSDVYAYYQGTSMATPHVAGVVALMLAKEPGLTPDQVESKLKSTARAFPASCSGCGTGIVDAARALGSTPPPPPPSGDIEPNNSLGTAQNVAAPNTINGTIGSTSDEDYFKVTLPAGATLTATLTPNASSDYDLYLYNSSGSQIGASENGTGRTDSLSTSNRGTSALVRYVRVVRYSGGTGSTNGKYSLKLSW
ncbi:S8 family peptidase [Chitinimonas lacunae]|uniref:S8 family peptidase n=1 Tax=Chitinimonas lacunae TaxID=1963018 RepID=A0ABV8MVZ6_9NEIS